MIKIESITDLLSYRDIELYEADERFIYAIVQCPDCEGTRSVGQYVGDYEEFYPCHCDDGRVPIEIPKKIMSDIFECHLCKEFHHIDRLAVKHCAGELECEFCLQKSADRAREIAA